MNVYPFQVPAIETTLVQRTGSAREGFRVTTAEVDEDAERIAEQQRAAAEAQAKLDEHAIPAFYLESHEVRGAGIAAEGSDDEPTNTHRSGDAEAR